VPLNLFVPLHPFKYQKNRPLLVVAIFLPFGTVSSVSNKKEKPLSEIYVATAEDVSPLDGNGRNSSLSSRMIWFYRCLAGINISYDFKRLCSYQVTYIPLQKGISHRGREEEAKIQKRWNEV